MSNGTTAWAQLATSNNIAYAIPFIDPSTLQPVLDSGNVAGLPTGGGLVYVANKSGAPFTALGALSIGTAGDLSGTDPVNSGAQIDSYIPTTVQNASVGGVPGHTVSASRGSRYIPLNILDTDLLGEFSGYGYVSQAGVLSYQKLAGINCYAAGPSTTFPGGELRFGTRPDAGGNFTDWVKLDRNGHISPLTTGTTRLGIASKGFAALTLDYTISAVNGAVTINKPSGAGNIALGVSSVVVTNSLVTANSLVMAWLMQTDATLTFIKSIIPAAGSFTITGNANATANCKFGFLVISTDN